jgi:thioredoxin-related protein
MKKLYINLLIIFLFSNIAIAQTNNDSSLETLTQTKYIPKLLSSGLRRKV